MNSKIENRKSMGQRSKGASKSTFERTTNELVNKSAMQTRTKKQDSEVEHEVWIRLYTKDAQPVFDR